jgi:hypothetical protein
MFATDRDLLVIEPNLFRDTGWIAQRLVYAQGTVAGTTLTLSSWDVTPGDAGVAEGHVAIVGGVAYEVLGLLSDTQLRLSRLRASPTDPSIPPAPVTDQRAEIHTFGPQIAQAHHQILRMLGLEPQLPNQPGPDAVFNSAELAHVEALAALHAIFSAAVAPGGASPADPRLSKIQMYQQRFQDARARAVALIDSDGDGLPDASRRLNVAQFIRR